MTLEMSQFHDAFFEEAFESLDQMEAGLLQLDPGAPNAETINSVFRVAHSIKGGSGMFGFSDIASFTHTLETLLDELRNARMSVSSTTVDLLLKSTDVLRAMLKATRQATPIDQQVVADLQFDLEQLVALGSAPQAASTPPAMPVQAPPTAGALAEAKSEPAPESSARSTSSESNSIRVGIEKIDELMNTVGEMVITQSMLMQFAQASEPLEMERFRNGLTQLERNVRELQESVMRVRMLPISFTFSRFPRLVRDLASRLSKKVELRMTGEHTELDKTVLERIGDPLVHLIRNSLDHGIEAPEIRMAAGKSATGTVFLNAFHRGGAIVIEAGDDGSGLNLDRILAKARAKGLVGANDELSDDAIAELIFLPGFSTAEQTTDLSGRGVGMDVVRRNVKELGGKIEVHSERGRGSSFVITLPLTLAIVDGQSVGVGDETYIVPLLAIVESLQLKGAMVRSLVGRGEVFPFRGDYIPLIRLHQLFGTQQFQREIDQGIVMVVEGDGYKVGLFVDRLLGQQQVVIKSLETNYRRVDGISGATILGEGSVALILDVPGLIRVAAGQAAA